MKKEKFWISKYALTMNVFEVEAEPADTCNDMLVVRPDGKIGHTQYYHGEGRDWHRTKEAAVARAEQIRIKKIASIHKQVKRIEGLKFG